MGQPNLDQIDWNIGDDDATGNDPNTCTFEGCGVTGAAYTIGTIFHVRITVENNGSKDQGSVAWQLYVSATDSVVGADDVAGSTGAAADVDFAGSGNSTVPDGTNITSALCTGNITVTSGFSNGEFADNTETDSIGLVQDKYSEFQFAVKFAAGASGTYYFFLCADGVTMDDYTANGAQVTVATAITLTMTDDGAYHDVYTNVDNSPIDIVETDYDISLLMAEHLALTSAQGGASTYDFDAAGERAGMSFDVGGTQRVLAQLRFFCNKTGSPKGRAYAELWTHSGVYGTSSVPLARVAKSCNSWNLDDIPAGNFNRIFNFEPYTLLANTKYVAVLHVTGGDGSNFLSVYIDDTPVHGGNYSYKLYGGAWTAVADDDLNFTVRHVDYYNYHLHVPDNVVIDPAWVYPADCYHDLVDDGPYFMPIDVNDCYHDHVVTPTNLTIVEVEGAVDLVMTDDGAYHVLYDDGPLPPVQVYVDGTYHVLYDDGPLPPVQIYVDDCYHDLVDDGPLPPVQIYVDDAYHLHIASDPLWWPADAYHDLVDVPPYCFSVLGAYHDHVVDPTNLTLVQVGAIDLIMTDGGAYHLNVPNGDGSPLDLDLVLELTNDAYHDLYTNIDNSALVLQLVLETTADCYHDLVDSGPLPPVQIYADDTYHVLTDANLYVFSAEGAYHDHVVTPTNLTLEEIGDVTLANLNAVHVTYDDGPLPATQVYPDSTYHEHIPTPANLTLVEVIDLTLTPYPYHNLITKDEVWFIEQAVQIIATTPSDLTLDHTHILSIDSCFHVIEDGAPLTLVHILDLTISDAGVNYHDHVVTPTDLTISELGPVDLIMTGGGAYHLHTAPNLTLVIDTGLDIADAIRTLVNLTTNRTLHLL